MKDADVLEGVQRRATRLKRFGMFSLRRRKLRSDMIEVLKMIQGIETVNLENLFSIVEDERIRKHKFV